MRGSVQQLIIINGPTGTGKTGLAQQLLQHIRGEIISADSRQVFCAIDYATNKLSPNDANTDVQKHAGYWIQRGARINGYDLIEPNQLFSVDAFVAFGLDEIDRIWKLGGIPIIVGGTGFYSDSLIGQAPMSSVAPDARWREESTLLSTDQLQKELQRRDPIAWSEMSSGDQSNRVRLIRYLELVNAVGSVVDAQVWSPLKAKCEDGTVILKHISLTGPRSLLYQRADEWITALLSSGKLFEETRLLMEYQQGRVPLLESMLFKPTHEHIEGQIDQSELKNILYGQMHRYIRHQIIWFRRNSSIEWYDVSMDHVFDSITSNVITWLEYQKKD